MHHCLYSSSLIYHELIIPYWQKTNLQSIDLLQPDNAPSSTSLSQSEHSLIPSTLRLLTPQFHHHKHKRVRANTKQRRNPSLPIQLASHLKKAKVKGKEKQRYLHLSKHNTSPSD